MFFNVLASEHCKEETFYSLQYQYSLPDFLKLKQYVEIMDAYSMASQKDHEIKIKSETK